MSAQRTYEYYFAEREEITRRTLRPVKAIREKMAGMDFMHPEVSDAVQLIDHTLNALPKSGVIAGSDLESVSRLVGRSLTALGRVASEPSMDNNTSEVQIDVVRTTTDRHTGNVVPIAWDF